MLLRNAGGETSQPKARGCRRVCERALTPIVFLHKFLRPQELLQRAAACRYFGPVVSFKSNLRQCAG